MARRERAAEASDPLHAMDVGLWRGNELLVAAAGPD
jgi:hypothetical protein